MPYQILQVSLGLAAAIGAMPAQRAKVSPAPTFHILRHSHASMLAMRGVPLGVIAVQLGHQDTRMTEKHYAHLAPNQVADTIRAQFPTLSIANQTMVIPLRRKGQKPPSSTRVAAGEFGFLILNHVLKGGLDQYAIRLRSALKRRRYDTTERNPQPEENPTIRPMKKIKIDSFHASTAVPLSLFLFADLAAHNHSLADVEPPADATPLPAALPLFATGLGALDCSAGAGRKKHQHSLRDLKN